MYFKCNNCFKKLLRTFYTKFNILSLFNKREEKELGYRKNENKVIIKKYWFSKH